MKDFFSHYGWIVVAAAIIITVLMFTNPFGKQVTNSEMDMGDLLSDKTTEFMESLP